MWRETGCRRNFFRGSRVYIFETMPQFIESRSILRRRLLFTGMIVLLLGFLGALLVYWEGTQAAAFDDPSLANFNRLQRQQMARLYGTFYLKLIDFWMGFQHPGPEAIIIVVVSGVVAGGCFWLAWQIEG